MIDAEKIKSRLKKEDLVCNKHNNLIYVFRYFKNSIDYLLNNEVNKHYDITFMYDNVSKEKKIKEITLLINEFYNDPELITLKCQYQKNLSTFKLILKEIEDDAPYMRLCMNNNFFAIDDIRSLFFLNYESYYSNVNSAGWFLWIKDQFVNIKNIYIDIDKKYTEIINYLNFLCKYQYMLINNNRTLFYDLDINPNTFSKFDLRQQLYYMLRNYRVNNIEQAKTIWPLDEWTEEDENFVMDIKAKMLLNKLK